MSMGASEEHNRSVLEALFAETPDGAMRRAQLEEMVSTLRREFQHADIDLGFEYSSSPAVVPDGTQAPLRDPVGSEYLPVARPGHRLPHAWLLRRGERVATHHLLRGGHFLLLAGPRAHAWSQAAEAVAQDLGLPLDVHLVGAGCELEDPDGSWAALRGHEEDGVVLVRPDGHVAFRSPGADADPEGEIRHALFTALGRTPTPALATPVTAN
jgi:2,4-dichlorophenol 6-monooxygenase